MVEQQDVRLIYSHKYIENTTTCGTICTEHLQKKTGKRPQDYDRARKTLRNQIGHKKEEEQEKKQFRDLHKNALLSLRVFKDETHQAWWQEEQERKVQYSLNPFLMNPSIKIPELTTQGSSQRLELQSLDVNSAERNSAMKTLLQP